MIDYLTYDEVIELHQQVIATSGGLNGVRDSGAVESAVAQPQMGFGDQDSYVTIPEKAAALAFSIINNHAFLDGNKRTGHAAMELFLDSNGYDLLGSVDEQEQTILAVASGQMKREELSEWVANHSHPRNAS